MEQFFIQEEYATVLYCLQGIPDGIRCQTGFQLCLAFLQITHTGNENVVGIFRNDGFDTQIGQQAIFTVCNVDAAKLLLHTANHEAAIQRLHFG